MMSSLLLVPFVLTAFSPPSMIDVLQVERKEDKRGRVSVYNTLKQVRVDFHAEDMRASDVAAWLSLAAGEGVHFIYVGLDKGTSSEPTVSLDLKRLPLTSVMGVIQDVTDLAFVYRSGVVMMKPAAEVKQETELIVYDLRAAVAPLTSFRAPRIGQLRPSGYEPDEDDEEEAFTEGTISGFEIEDIERLVRQNVQLENWEDEGVHLTSSNGLLVVRQTERGHAQVRATLRAIGVGLF